MSVFVLLLVIIYEYWNTSVIRRLLVTDAVMIGLLSSKECGDLCSVYDSTNRNKNLREPVGLSSHILFLRTLCRFQVNTDSF